MERLWKYIFGLHAFVCVLAILIICISLFGSAIPTIYKVGFSEFIFGSDWYPEEEIFGIFPMIVGSIYVTAFSILLGVPLGIFCAIYIAFFASERMKRFILPAISLLGGIPSVVYGFFGLMMIVPFIASVFHGVQGKSLLAAAIVLSIMVLPTIILVSKAALEALPHSYLEGALALGASKQRSVFFVLVPAAKSGILASVILGVGRAIGEAMAVIMVAGNQTQIPSSVLDGVRTLSTNIVIEMGYASGLHAQVLIANALVLFVFILLINLGFNAFKRDRL